MTNPDQIIKRGPNLSRQQMAATECRGHALIVACPGSGKTTVLANLALKLLRSSRTAMVGTATFSKAASAELEKRILDQLPMARSRLQCGTFHKSAIEQLKAAGETVVLVSDALREEILIACARKASNSTKSLDELLQFVDLARSCRPDERDRLREHSLWRVLQDYEAELSAQGLVDFAAVMVLAVAGMAAGRIPLLQVHYLLIDEVQDADWVQWEWINIHARNGRKIIVVGDDDQSIYVWRGAAGYKGMAKFVEEFSPEVFTLDTTYRCAPAIVQAAAKVIAPVTDRIQKQLFTPKLIRGSVEFLPFDSRDREADAVATAIVTSDPTNTWGIFAKKNRTLDGLQQALEGKGISYTRVGGTHFWDLPGPAIFLGALEAVVYNQLHHAEALLLGASRNDAHFFEIVRACKPTEKGSLVRFCETSLHGERPYISSIGMLQTAFLRWRDLLKNGEISNVLVGLALMMDSFLPAAKSEFAWKCVESINNRSGPLHKRINQLKFATKDQMGRITLMTLHGSKGLEFDRAWIIGCDPGEIPNGSRLSDEERRLLYVGFTRARIALGVSGVVKDNAAGIPFFDELSDLPVRLDRLPLQRQVSSVS